MELLLAQAPPTISGSLNFGENLKGCISGYHRPTAVMPLAACWIASVFADLLLPAGHWYTRPPNPFACAVRDMYHALQPEPVERRHKRVGLKSAWPRSGQ